MKAFLAFVGLVSALRICLRAICESDKSFAYCKLCRALETPADLGRFALNALFLDESEMAIEESSFSELDRMRRLGTA